MNPRQRVISALNHKEPDRVPIDLAATTVTSITYPAYESLRQYLGMAPDANLTISHIHQGTASPQEDLLEHFQVDFRTLYMKRSPRGFVVKQNADGSFFDEYNMLWAKAEHDYYPTTAPLADCDLADLDSVIWPDPNNPARVAGLAEEAKTLFENTEYALVGDIMCRGPFELAVKLRGYEKFLMDLALEPKFAEALLDKIVETVISLWDVYLDAVGDYVQIVCQGDDIGMQTSLIISPQMYRQLIKPCHRKIYSFIHTKTDAKIFMHTDGSVYDILPDLIEVGVDILNPIQYGATNMELPKLKQAFGQEICFWGGGIDTQQILPYANPAQIEEEVKRNIEIMAPGGGYVFAMTHNIQPDIPPDRLATAYEAALKHGHYA